MENQLYWIERFKDVLDSKTKVEVKKLVIARIAVDESILKHNGRKCYLFAALDVERNKIIHLNLSCEECFNSLFFPQGSFKDVRG